MLRTISVCEKNISVTAPRVITLVAATPTEIFPQEAGLAGPEIVTRYVQNLTGGDLYLSFGVSKANGTPQCDNALMFHAVISDRQLFDTFPHAQRICAYSVGGGAVCTTRLYRTDLGQVN